LEDIPKESSSLAASKEHSTLLSKPAEHLQDKSSMEVTTMDISVVKNRQPDAVLTAEKDKFAVEMALLVTLEAGRDVREEEQLANGCYITIKSGQLAVADTNYFIKPIIWVQADSIPLVTMQRRAKYSLHEKVDRRGSPS
jgi:hypothetical protein